MGVTDSVISLSPGTTCNADGICELTQDVSDSPFYSRDVAPVPIAVRKWATKDIAALWISHVGVHPDVHAGLVPDRRGDELVAGACSPSSWAT